MEGEEEALLPPGYVSLAQLQERWLKNQEERKRREEEEKKLREKREEERRNSERGKRGIGSARYGAGAGRRGGRYGGEMGVIDDKGKGKAIVVDARENGVGAGRRGGRHDGEMGVIDYKGKGKAIVVDARENGVGAGRRGGRHDGEMGVIDDKGKGKAIVVDARENGVENKNYKKKKGKKGSSGKKNFAGDRGNEKVRTEKQVGIGVEIVPENGLEGVEEIASVAMVEVLPVKGEITDVKREDLRGRLRKNGYDRGSFSKSGDDRGGSFNDLRQSEERLASGKKMEDEKGYDDKKRGERGRKYGKYRASRDDESRKKAEAGISEDFSEKCGINGGDENGERERNKAKEDSLEGEGLSDDMVALDKKVDDEVLVVESAENGKSGGIGKAYRRYNGNWKGNFGGRGERGRKYGKYRASRDDESRKKAEAGTSEDFSEKCGINGGDENGERERNKAKEDSLEGEGLSDDMVALDKKVDDEVLVVESAENGESGGIGKAYRRYNGNWKGNFGGRGERGRKYGKYRASRDDESRKKAEAGISEDFSEKCGINGGDENGERERNKAKEDSLEGEGLSDDMVALDKKVDDEVLVVESAENGESGGIGKAYRRYNGNWKGNFGGRGERGRKYGKYRASRDDESRKKAEAGISEDFSEKCGINGGDENGERERNKAKEDSLEGEGLSDDMVALDKKVDDEVLVVESAENGESGGIGKAYRRYNGNWKGNFGGGGRYARPRSFEGGVGMEHMRHGNWKGNFDQEGRYRNHRSFDMKQGDSGMIWVKKEEKSGADAAEVGPSGVRVSWFN